jgi:hypothetical protein
MDEQTLTEAAVYFALFRVVEVAELEGAEAGVAWAQDALDWPRLRTGLVEGAAESLRQGRARA